MRVPIRKPGKYTHLKPDPHLTEAKFDELKKELEHLIKLRPEAASEVKRLAEMGDFSENAAYQMAKGRLRGINENIEKIQEHLKRAIIIEPGKDGRVRLGSNVTVEINGKPKTYLILGSSETDPAQGVISHNSPMGAALMGHRAGDPVKLKSKDKVINCIILNVS